MQAAKAASHRHHARGGGPSQTSKATFSPSPPAQNMRHQPGGHIRCLSFPSPELERTRKLAGALDPNSVNPDSPLARLGLGNSGTT